MHLEKSSLGKKQSQVHSHQQLYESTSILNIFSYFLKDFIGCSSVFNAL